MTGAGLQGRPARGPAGRGRTTVSRKGRILAAVLVVVATVVGVGLYIQRDLIWGTRADVRSAIGSLKEGDLLGLQVKLAAYRGDEDFAYYFARDTTPRLLGDALATAAGPSAEVPLSPVLDAETYEIALTDLAGVLSLATHGAGNRALPAAWTTDFVAGATDPGSLYGTHENLLDIEGRSRDRQDTANRSHLLLLLSRGYWSTDFLRSVTAGFYLHDRSAGAKAWPAVDPGSKARHAPSPSGVHLTDGIVALSAALTANADAALWALTEFLPGTVPLEDTGHVIGAFTHYLLFEHRYPENGDGENVGSTSALTALASAIDAQTWQSVEAQIVAAENAEADETDGDLPVAPAVPTTGPAHDAAVLMSLAADATADNGCSWNPLDYGYCIAAAAKAVWTWVKRWGHSVLEVLSLATFVPAFGMVGAAAATINAGWYAIEGDYGAAGLSLAVAVPGLAVSRLLKGGRIAAEAGAAIGTGTVAVGSAAAPRVMKVLDAARKWRRNPHLPSCSQYGKDVLQLTPKPGWSAAQLKEAHEKVDALDKAGKNGGLVKTKVENKTSARALYTKGTGKEIPAGQDADHVIDRQLGGANDISNIKPLDRSVNRSFGKQIQLQLAEFGDGAKFAGAVVCQR